jgi:YidC/Oxa1 family membrane protein insertase
MQKKNLILFFLTTLLILVGWTQFERWYWPPKQVADRRVVQVAQLAGAYAPGGSGVENAVRLAAELSYAVPPGPARVAKKEEVKAKKPPEAEVNKPPPKPKPPDVQAAKVEDVDMGGDGFNLSVRVTSEGGAIRQIVLNQFQEADHYGLPVWQDAAHKVPKKMELAPQFRAVQREGRREQLLHYQLLHYAKLDDERPLDTLGHVPWKFEKRETTPDSDHHEVVLTADVPGTDVRITKKYTLERGDYHIGLSVKVQRTGKGAGKVKLRLQLAGARGLPIEGEWYTYIYRNALFGWVDNRGVAWRHLEDARQIAHWDGGDKHDRGDKLLQYAAVAIQSFASAIVVAEAEEQPTKRANFLDWARATVEGPIDKEKPYLTDITVRAVTEPIELEAGQEVEHKYLLYNGPVKVLLLGQEPNVTPGLVPRYEYKLHLNTLTDYHSPGWMGEFADKIGLSRVIIFFTNVMHEVLWIFHRYLWLPYGICIVCLTVLVRGLMHPISRRQAMNAKKMQEKMEKLKPELERLQQKYKDDFQTLQQEKTQLMLRHGINPVAQLGGCLLLFVQLPIFMGLYYALQESIHFRLEPFLWIRNLAAPDMLIWWSEHIPLISDPASQGGMLYLGPYFNLLPVLAVVLMWFQQKLTMPPPTDEQQEMQQKMMKIMMPVFGLMFYKVAAGLCIYFIASSLWGLAERKLLPKTKPAVAGAAPAAGSPGGRGKPVRPKPRGPKENGNGAFSKVREWWEQVLREAKKK